MLFYHHSHAARGLEAVRNTSNGTDSLEFVATQLNITTALSIIITTNTTLGRTYECALGLPSVVEITYRDPPRIEWSRRCGEGFPPRQPSRAPFCSLLTA